MKEATACAWIESSDFQKFSAVWSYATSSNANEWFLGFLNPTAFRIGRPNDVDFAVSQLNGRQRVTEKFSLKFGILLHMG